MSTVYCVDASIFIRLVAHYPAAIFSRLWENLDDLAQQRRLLVPYLVLKETGSDKRIAEWLRARPHVLCDMDDGLNDSLLEVMAALPGFVDPSKTAVFEADQILVALALQQNRESHGTDAGSCHVATLEGRRKPRSSRLRIPDACDHYGIRCHDLFGMMQNEGWKF